MVDIDDDNDDLWDFSTPGGAEPVPQSDNESDKDDEDGLRALPAKKRRKLQKRLIEVPDLVIVDDSSEPEEPDPDMKIVEEIRRKNQAKKAKNQDDIEFLDLTNIVPQSDSRFRAKYEATQAEIRQNLARLDEVKAMLHAREPEPVEPVERATTSQQPVDDGADDEAEAQVEPELDKIIVKIQGKSKDVPIKLRIGKRSQLEKLFSAFSKRAAELEWLTEGTPIKFVFDGEVIRPTDTAEDLDIEEDCVIEAHWQEGL